MYKLNKLLNILIWFITLLIMIFICYLLDITKVGDYKERYEAYPINIQGTIIKRLDFALLYVVLECKEHDNFEIRVGEDLDFMVFDFNSIESDTYKEVIAIYNANENILYLDTVYTTDGKNSPSIITFIDCNNISFSFLVNKLLYELDKYPNNIPDNIGDAVIQGNPVEIEQDIFGIYKIKK